MASFFGYGSLVNTRTHTYGGATGHLVGWRRCWCPVAARPAAFLSVLPDAGTTLLGLVAPVPNQDWDALDRREAQYQRIDVSDQFEGPTVVYSVPKTRVEPKLERTIWLSYLDVVLQGYLHQFGEAGPQHFMETTDGWDIGITNDRAKPHYPRAQQLSVAETALVDDLTGHYWR